ncbi:unnamed protein product [Darwinula stevensoni]|uniref:Uncharacterized protein n=1 Tax=Darwinula stevensoni TaxID=69355 RepID=A0A7R8X6H1_9CRUS|nr:unnamed protein product [Darwinula stevensoni]CAG0879443.1 unnamed protein product [Darwinula stevensoni]
MMNERQKKKRRSKRNVSESASQEHATEQALALGTASGSVLLYSIIKGEPIQELNEGHSKAVQGMSFRSCDETLFTCSADHYLIEWDTYKGSVRRQIDEAKSKATAVATLMLSDEPRHLDMVAADTHHSTTLVATTAAQEIEIFEFQLNGHHQEPVKPCSRIQIRSKQENSFSEDPQKQRIFGGKVLHQGSSRKLLLAYGSALKPSFENLVMSGMKAKRARFLGPGTIGIVPVGKEPSLPLLMEAKEAFGGGKSSQRETSYMDGKKAKEKERKGTGDETIGERLETMKRDSAQATAPPMDGLAHLLLQGLQSNDKAVLRSVLDRTEESVRKGTICRLPVPAISPLINTLQKLIAQKRAVGANTHLAQFQSENV